MAFFSFRLFLFVISLRFYEGKISPTITRSFASFKALSASDLKYKQTITRFSYRLTLILFLFNAEFDLILIFTLLTQSQGSKKQFLRQMTAFRNTLDWARNRLFDNFENLNLTNHAANWQQKFEGQIFVKEMEFLIKSSRKKNIEFAKNVQKSFQNLLV